MINCIHAHQTGKSCHSTNLSREITCEHSVTRCLKDCAVTCPQYSNGTPRRTNTATPTNNVTRITQRTTDTPHRSGNGGGCGCGGGKAANNLNAYTSRGVTY
jgi:hypothetical protein